MFLSALWWLGLNFFFLFMLAFYSMVEMAFVSFNKLRLQYYVSKGYKKAIWLNTLLQHPAHLFGTTLIGVNIALVVGSECSRQFYAALGLSPDLAPLTQVPLVIVIAELAPIIAARQYAEHVSMLGVPLVYASSKAMAPFLWAIRMITKVPHLILGTLDAQANIFITQEELQKIFERTDEKRLLSEKSEGLNRMASKVLSLRSKSAVHLMEPLHSIPVVSSNCTVGRMREILKKTFFPFLPIYHRDITNIVGIAFPRRLLRIADTRRVEDYAHQPWFITHDSNALEILKQFRHNNQSVAVVLNEQGKAVGLLTFENIIEEIFGSIEYQQKSHKKLFKPQNLLIIERTFPGNMKVAGFNTLFDVHIDPHGVETFSQLIAHLLGRNPAVGDVLYLDPFELTVKETSFFEVKTLSVKTKTK